jgi:multiple sugar transport system substrate-binding protein
MHTIHLHNLIRICAIACLLALSLAGCVKATPTPEPVTIAFAYPDVDQEHYQPLVQQFNERYPYITVEMRPKSWDMLGGLDPEDADVFATSQFAMDWLTGEDRVLNLTPFVEQDEAFDLADYYPGTVELYSREGEIWGIPSGVDMMVMFYNQDLFDQYNVPYPESGWTWDDFLGAAMALRDPGAGVFGYTPNLGMFDPLTFIYQHGGGIFDSLANPTRTTFDDLLAVEALDWFVKLSQDYNVAPTPHQLREEFGGRTPAGVLQNKVAMWSGMLSERGGQLWQIEWNMRWGAVSLPRDKESATMTIVEGYFVSSKSQHPEACWQWIAFMSEHTPSRQAPTRRSLAESANYEQQVGSEVAAVVRTSMQDALMLSPELVRFEQALGLFEQAFQTVLDGRSTPEEAMTWAQQQAEQR